MSDRPSSDNEDKQTPNSPGEQYSSSDLQSNSGQPINIQANDAQVNDAQVNNGQPNDGQPNDGQPNDGQPENGQPAAANVVKDFSERITNAVGVDKIEGFSIKELFSEVFKKHSEDEVEEFFTIGSISTTPDIEAVDTRWPKPWIFFRTFVGALLVYFGFVVGWNQFENINLIPGLIIVGSFAIPLATLIFFYEANARQNISLYQVLRMVFLGGILSLIFSLFLFQVSNNFALRWIGPPLAGIIEEPGKLLALLLVVNIPRYRYIHNGLLFGAAVGAGFSAFESAGYALIALIFGSPDAMLSSIFQRGILAPFGHIVWTGMSAAVLWKIKEDRKFEFSMLQDPKFIRVFGAAVVLHMLWNSPIVLPFYANYLALGFVAWVIVLSLMQDGLKQLKSEKLASPSIQKLGETTVATESS